LLPAPLEELHEMPAGGDKSWHVGFLDKDHPALAPLTEPASLYQSVLVYKHFPLTWTPQSEGRVLARLDDGQPLLVERAVGSGSVLMLGTGVHVEWTNLPLKPLFLPLLARLTFHLAGAEPERSQVLAGAPLVVPLGGQANPVEVEVVRPSGETLRVPGRGQNAQAFRYADTHEAGVYLLRLLGGKQPKQFAFAVNPDPDEADPTALTSEDLKARFGPHPLLFCENPEDLAGTVRRLREGESLWEWFLSAVLLGLVLEAFLANRLGSPPPPALPQPPEREERVEAQEAQPEEEPFNFSARE
jgi:hypothetical protein